MGYYYISEPENAVPPKSCAKPKTHTPGSAVKERGHRFYMPEIGRWVSRDPMDKRLADTWDPYLFCRNNTLLYYDPDGREASSSAGTGSGGAVEDPCKSLPPWNQPGTELGNTTWCLKCGKATLTDAGKSLPAAMQACILKHEKQHETTCPTIGFWERCCNPEKALCHRAKDEVTAYGIDLTCAKEALDKGDIPDDEKKHWDCYVKNAEKQKAHYEKYVSEHCK